MKLDEINKTQVESACIKTISRTLTVRPEFVYFSHGETTLVRMIFEPELYYINLQTLEEMRSNLVKEGYKVTDIRMIPKYFRVRFFIEFEI